MHLGFEQEGTESTEAVIVLRFLRYLLFEKMRAGVTGLDRLCNHGPADPQHAEHLDGPILSESRGSDETHWSRRAAETARRRRACSGVLFAVT